MSRCFCSFSLIACFFALVHIRIVHSQDNSCTFDGGSVPRANLIQKVEDSFTFTDEQYLSDFQKWGVFCCNNAAETFTADLNSNIGWSPTSCNNLNAPGNVELEIRKTAEACNRDGVPDYIVCEIYLRGNLSRYLDRRRECTYSPVPLLSCSNGLRGGTLATSPEVKIIDQNTKPQWSATSEVNLDVSEHHSLSTLLINPVENPNLYVIEPNDIWGSANWNISLSLVYDNVPFPMEIDYARTIYPNPNPANPLPDRTIPAIRISRRIAYTECSSVNPPCVFTAQLVATDGNGLTSAIRLRLSVVDENDLPPLFEQPYQEFVIDEDNELEPIFPVNMRAYDQDTGISCPLVYSVSASAPYFAVDANGQLSLNSALPEWSPSGTNIFTVIITATEDESSGPKCSSKMVATATVVVKLTSPRSVPAEISTEPDIITAKKFVASQESLGQIIVRRNGQPVENVRFAMSSGDDFLVDQFNGTLYKKEGVRLVNTSGVVVIVTDEENRNLGNINVVVTVDHPPTPQFSQTLYETDIYDGDELALNDMFTEKPEGCEMTISADDGPVPDAMSVITSAEWLDWVTRTKRYRSVYTAVCRVTDTPLMTTAKLAVNWHPQPEFDLQAYSSLTIKENSTYPSVISVLSPLHNFPYPLTFQIRDTVPEFIIDENGRLSLVQPLNFTGQSSYNFEIVAQDGGISKVIPVFIQVLPHVLTPATWMHFVPTVSCGASVALPVDIGEENHTDLEIRVIGANSECATISDLNGHFNLFVEFTPECGVNFSLVLLLTVKGKDYEETVVVDVVGCPAVVEPMFAETFQETDFYFDSLSPVQFTGVENCTDCTCRFVSPNVPSEVQLDLRTGVVSVSRIPSSVSADLDYDSAFVVECTSSSSSKSASTNIRIKWHPVPAFPISPLEVTIADDTLNGTIAESLRPRQHFPYLLQYSIQNSGVPFVIENGNLVYMTSDNSPLEQSYALIIDAGEPGHLPASILVNVRVNFPFQPAKFTESVLDFPCDGTERSISVDIGFEVWNDIRFDVVTIRQECVKLDFSVAGILTVTPNTNGVCGSQFAVAIELQGRDASSKDIIVVEFTGCQIPSTIESVPIFPDTFYDVHWYFDSPSFLSTPAVTNCSDCTCRLSSKNMSESLSNLAYDASTGSINITQLPQDPLQYLTTVEMRCTSLSSSKQAAMIIQIFWHPQPEFPAFTAPVEVFDNGLAENIVTSLGPRDYFPYPLTYTIRFPTDSPFNIEYGVLILQRELLPPGITESLEHSLTIDAGEPGHLTSISVTVIVSQSGASDTTSSTYSSTTSTSQSTTTVSTTGAESGSGTTTDPSPPSSSSEAVVPEPPGPSFPQAFYYLHWYFDSEFFRTTPSVSNCPACMCALSPLNATDPIPSLLDFNSETGSINITQLPPSITVFVTTLMVTCSAGDKEATMVVQIYWHPQPKFQVFDKPVAIYAHGPVDVMVASLAPVSYFPYQLAYQIQNSSASYPFKISDGALVMKRESYYLDESEYSVDILAGEPGHFISILVNVNVTRSAPSFRPATFVQSLVPAVQCEDPAVVDVQLNDQKWDELQFEKFLDDRHCAALTEKRDESTIVINALSNPESTCGPQFSVVIKMSNKITGEEVDTSVVTFVGCQAGSTSTVHKASSTHSTTSNPGEPILTNSTVSTTIATTTATGIVDQNSTISTTATTAGPPTGDTTDSTTPPPTRPTATPVGSLNLLSAYTSQFNDSVGKFFDFNPSSKELHIKDLPDTESLFHLDFAPDTSRSTRTDQIPRAENYVLSVRMLSGATKIPEAPVFGTTEIVLVVVGSLLLIALIVILVGFVKFYRQRKPNVAVEDNAPAAITKSNIELAHRTTELDRPIIVTAASSRYGGTVNSSRHGGTMNSIPNFVESLRGESETASARNRAGSGSMEFEPDQMRLVENENLEHESTDSILSGEVIHNPPFEYEPITEVPLTVANDTEADSTVITEIEPEPEPDYEVTVIPPPPPPPPPVTIGIPTAVPRTPSQDKLLEQSDQSEGEKFLNELKTAVADPYKVLKPLVNENAVNEPDADRKVRFGPAVEVITSPPGTPTLIENSLKNDVISPPVPTYSPMLSHNLAKNTTLIMPSPPSPAYVSPLILASQKEPQPVVTSPPVPMYVSSADKRLHRQGSVTSQDEIVSHRQISRDMITEPPPLPSPLAQIFGADSTAETYGQPEDDEDDSRTAL
ncbi:uncharacterized protein LOC129598398 isoform X2 [Paramacrobiotus metropolitanus]|uniref:uncharacterized protein LOC129598398 isoform X2 n=1 Tax=Paramacrobiotus metropolitanus TaxID=2943436 RepID=UPI002445FA9F|nr:uncharacterized protein LOC129598398 isoform X2 [Paramacrobiotus metropolitanus]